MKILALFFFLSNPCWAQVYESTVEDVIFNSSDRVVLTQEMIEKTQAHDLPSLLTSAGNISITNTPFQPSTLSIRGGDSGHILVLIDGIPYYDPSTVQRTADLSMINVRMIKSIEIIKGSQSVLYGGQAMSGVIKITTFAKGDAQTALIEGGTQSHHAAGVEFSKSGIVAQGFYQDREAESPRKYSRDHYPTENDNVSLAYRWDQSSEGYIKASHFHDHSFSPSSDMNFQVVDVDNFKLGGEQTYFSSVTQFKNLKWKPTLSVGIQGSQRSYDFPVSAQNPTELDEDYQAHFQYYRIDVTPFSNEQTTIDGGVQYSVEDFLFKDKGLKQSEALSEQKNVFIKFTNHLDEKSTFTYGARMDNWSHEVPVSAYQVGYTYDKTKLEVSTGYKSPTLYQLHSNFGNPHLHQEKSMQYNLTQEISLGETQNISVSAFYSKFDDLISTTGNFPNISYVNINKTETHGAELSYSRFLGLGHSIILNLGYQEPRDLDQQHWLARRPLMNGSLRYFYDDFWGNISLEFIGVGARQDVGPSGYKKLQGYIVTNFACNIKLDRTDKFYFRLDNLTSSRYEETYGYFAPHFSAVLGWQGEIPF